MTRHAETQLTILTFNTHGGRDEDGAASTGRQAEEIRGIEPDVLLLQEVDVHTLRSGRRNQVKELSEALDLPHVAFAPAMIHDGGLYGNAVLSRFPIRQWHPLPFRATPSQDIVHIDDKLRRWPQKAEPRGACLARLAVDDCCELTVVAGHLSIFPEERAAAAADLTTVLPDGPLIVGLDLNTENREEPVWASLLTHLKDLAAGHPAHCAPTYPAGSPAFSIDALLGRHVTAVHADRLLSRASDHCGVFARIRVHVPD